MILTGGKILDSSLSGEILDRMGDELNETFKLPTLKAITVINACQKLADSISAGKYNDIISELGELASPEIVNAVVAQLQTESLIFKVKNELGEDYDKETLCSPPFASPMKKRIMPLGVLLHIAAGNVDGLPAYSVIEGLLAGNINLLKLPSADNGLSVKLLYELIQLEPSLAPYIYVFDTPSSDFISIKRMAEYADGIVVWGGDAAVTAVRKMAAPDTRIIEWGHKLSFAYITEKGIEDEASLCGLAHHIFTTKQLLCSSCQGIFIDTDDMQLLDDFCNKFIKIMDRVSSQYPAPDIGTQAQITLIRCNSELEAIFSSDKRMYCANGCSVTSYENKTLELSMMFGNPWVKRLERENIYKALRPYKSYLQTVGLICGEDARSELALTFAKAGAVRITHAGNMSRMSCGDAHDGEYPLRRYSRIAEIEE